jgi:undecaprenyl-diphosphatase
VVAILIVFGKEAMEIILHKRRVLLLILLGSIVTFACVVFFIKNIEAAFNDVRIVGFMFIITGIWLMLGNLMRFGTEGLTGVKAIIIGLAQAIAALPGISRSGATISTGLFLGLDGQTSAKFSFLLSIPAVIGAFIFKLKAQHGLGFPELHPNYFIGFLVSCVIGVISLKLLLRVLYRNRFHWFAAYCIALGIAVLLFLK